MESLSNHEAKNKIPIFSLHSLLQSSSFSRRGYKKECRRVNMVEILCTRE
jgi:hypothetical protein